MKLYEISRKYFISDQRAILLLEAYANQPLITGLGTILTGNWNAATIGYQYGGTGLNTLGTAGQVLGVDNSNDGV